MRTISAAQAAVYALPQGPRQIRLRVKVKDGAGVFQNLCALESRDWVRSLSHNTNLDSPVDEVTLSLWRNEYQMSMAPLMSVSKFNRISEVYSPLLDLGREILIEAALLPVDSSPADGDWENIFEGRITAIDWGGAQSAINLTCRDKAGLLMDTYIETERSYGASDGSVLAEDVMQGILDDNGFSDVILYAPEASAWAIKPYTQRKEPILQALRTLALQRGWDVRFKWDSATETWRLTFYEPDRTKSVADRTVGPESYHAINRLAMGIDDIRTVVRVVYTDEADGTRKTIEYPRSGQASAGGAETLTDGAQAWDINQFAGDLLFIYAGTGAGQEREIISNTAMEITVAAWDTQPDNTSKYAIVDPDDTAEPLKLYGRRFMELAESSSSQIDTAGEAKVMARAGYNDCSAPAMEQEVEMPYFLHAELGDLYEFSPNGVHYDEEQLLAIVSITHQLTADKCRTTMVCRGKPAGGYAIWLARETRPGVAPSAPFMPPYIPATAPTVTPGIKQFSVVLPGSTDVIDHYTIQRREAPATYIADTGQYEVPEDPEWEDDWSDLPSAKVWLSRAYPDPEVAFGKCYQYRYAAVDVKGNTSGYSEESAAAVPLPITGSLSSANPDDSARYTWVYNETYDSLDLIFYDGATSTVILRAAYAGDMPGIIVPSGFHQVSLASLEAAVDPLYIGLYTAPGKIVEIDLDGFKRCRAMDLASGLDYVTALAYYSGNIYVMNYSDVTLQRIDRTDFSIVTSVALGAGTYGYGLDIHDGVLYTGVGAELSPRTRNLSTLDLIKSYTATFTPAWMYSNGTNVWVIKHFSPTAIRKLTINLGITGTDVTLPSGTAARFRCGSFIGSEIFVVTSKSAGTSRIYKYTASTLAAVANADGLSVGNDVNVCCCDDGSHIYVGSGDSPARISKVTPSTLAITSIDLETGEDDCRVIVYKDGYLYAGLGTSPAKIVKINAATMQRVGVLTLNSGENICASMALGG